MNLVRKLIFFAVCAAIGLFALAFFNLRLFYGPWPWQSPQEADRVHHPDGYSIIKPHGWVHKARVQLPQSRYLGTLGLQPNTQARLSPFITVAQFTSPPDISLMKTSFAYQAGGLRDGSFQGQPAQVYEGNSGKYWNWEVLFERGGWWFRISVMSPSESEAEDHVREDLLPYVHSFQVDKEKAHHSDK